MEMVSKKFQGRAGKNAASKPCRSAWVSSLCSHAWSCLALVAIMLCTHAAKATPLPEPKRDFRARFVFETEGKQMEGVLFHSGPKERREITMRGVVQNFILRKDRKVMWILMDEHKMYMEVPLAQAYNDLPSGISPNADVTQKALGKEVLDGIPTTRYKAWASPTDGSRFEGDMWLSADDIIVKVEGVAISTKGKKTPIRMQLSDLKLEPQPAKLFVLPKGYSALPTAKPKHSP